MSTYPVPGDWFEDVAAESEDDDGSDPDTYPVDEEPYDYYQARQSSLAAERPLSRAIRELRALSDVLKRERHALAYVPATIARELLDIHAPTPAPTRGAEPSPTGNCERCGAPLPLTAMGRGRPRSLCLRCSPRRPRNNPVKNNR